jgi:hypothetical protein
MPSRWRTARCGAHAYNHSTLEAEVGGLQVQGQPELHSKTLSQEKEKVYR